MLRIDDRLGSYAIAAGEAWIMSVQMKRMQGSSIIDWSQRRLVLSFYENSRALFTQIEGVYTSDATGAYFAFVRDGRFSELLFGKQLQVELAERLLEGRAIIATGPLTVAPSASGVLSFGSAIGRVDARFTLYFGTTGLIDLIEQELLPYGGNPVTPAPVITSPAAINSDGTPQVGEVLTGVDPVVTYGSVTARRWLLGSTTLATTQTYTPTATGDHRFQADIKGADGSTVQNTATITVAAAAAPAPSFTVQPSISGTPQVGQTLTGNSGTISNGSVSARQWLRDGVVISGATAATYVLVGADAGKGVTFRVTATGAGGSTDATSQAVTVAAAPTAVSISGTPPTSGQVGQPYSFTPTTANGSGTKTFTLSSGTLLGGLTFNTATGAISGSPTVAGTMSGLVVTVADSTGNASTTPTNVTIAAAAAATGDMTALRVRDATLMDTYTDNIGTFGIDGNGWVAEVTLKGLTAPTADSSSDGFFDCTKLELLVSDPGFRAVGGDIVASTVYRKVIGRAVLRKQYKTDRSQIAERFITQSGSDLVVYVALGEQLYTGSTIVSATIASGFYNNGSAVSNASSATAVANNSTYAYRKPTATWLNTPHLRATGDFPVEMVAFHRHAMGGRQVAGIKFQARDMTGNVSAEQTVGTVSLSALVKATSLRPEVYKATIPVSALNQAELCFVNAKVYPHIGDASAVYDLSVDGTNTGLTRTPDTSPHTRLRFLNDKAGTYSGVALCDANVVYTPIASSSSSSTPSSGFDGNYTSGYGWQCTAYEENAWLGQTFPNPVNVAEFRIWANGADATRTFTTPVLEYSLDGTTWVQVGAMQTAAAWTTPYSQMQAFVPGGNGPSGGARYWRVRQPGKNGTYAFTGAQEIEFAAVAGGVNIANGAPAATLADARQYPFATVGAAYRGIKGLNAIKGHDDYAGGKIYLANSVSGTTIEYGALATIPEPTKIGLTWCELLPDPAAVGTIKWTGKAVNTGVPSMTRAVGLTLKHTAAGNSPFFFDANQGSNLGALSWESCVYEPRAAGGSTGSNSGVFGYHMHYRTNCSSINNGNFLQVAGDATAVGGIQRGLALAVGNAVPADAGGAPAQVFIANTGGIYQGNEEATMPAVTDGYFLAYNFLSYSTGPSLGLLSKTRPTVIAQNVCEFKGNGPAVIAFNRSAEGANSTVFEMLDMHNTMLGNRGSRMYAEVAADRGIKKEGVSIGNVEMQWNIKTDSFDGTSAGGTAGQPGNTGNWRYYHQVGLRSNIALTGALPMSDLGDSSYLGRAWEPKYSSFLISKDIPTIKALFVSYQAQENGNGTIGAGGGDYHPASKTNALNGRMAAAWASYNGNFTDPINGSVFTFAQDGAVRRQDGTGAAGAFES